MALAMEGEEHIAASTRRVWEAINDPGILKAAIPGCQSLEKTSETDFAATVVLKIGPIKATFNAQVSLRDLNAPHSCMIEGEGKGGIAGFAKGSANVVLIEDGPDATILRYVAKADVGGKIAQLGSRLILSTAKKLAGEFFATLGKSVSGPGPA